MKKIMDFHCHNDYGACFYPFFHMYQRIKVYVINPYFPEESMQTIEHGVIYKYENGKILEDRPANVLVAGNQNEYLFISARTMLYAKKIK